MPGLDPGIYAVASQRFEALMEWIAGSSPAMTETLGGSRLRHLADKGKLAIAVGKVHAVAHDKDRRTAKAHEIGHDRRRARHLRVVENAGPDALGHAFRKERLGEVKRASYIENVVDDHDFAASESDLD